MVRYLSAATRMFENLGINLGYIRKMKERNATEFIDMAKSARLKASSNGKQLIRGDYNAGDYDDTGYISIIISRWLFCS